MAKSVSQIPGVVSSDLNFASGVLLLEYGPDSDPRETALAAVRRAGHGIAPLGVRPETGVALFELAEKDCADCAKEVRDVLESIPGVAAVLFEPGARRFRVTFDPASVSVQGLTDAMGRAGLPAHSVARSLESTAAARPWWSELRTEIAVVLGGALIVLA